MERSERGKPPVVDPRTEGGHVVVTSRLWHTVDGNAHEEGTAYTVDDRWLAETLYGIGFVTIGNYYPPSEPPPEDWRRDRSRP